MIHLSARKSGRPALCPKSWAGSPANQARALIFPHLQLLLTTLQDQAVRGAPDVDSAAVPKVSLLPAAGNQALWARRQVVSVHSHATKGGKVSSSESELCCNEEDIAGEDENAEADKGGVETSSDGQVASNGEDRQECPQTQDTLTSVRQVSGRHEDTDPESNPGEEFQPIWQKQRPKSPKEDSPLKVSRESSSEEEPPTDEALDERPGKKLSCWTQVSMLGITKRLLKALRAGPPETP